MVYVATTTVSKDIFVLINNRTNRRISKLIIQNKIITEGFLIIYLPNSPLTVVRIGAYIFSLKCIIRVIHLQCISRPQINKDLSGPQA